MKSPNPALPVSCMRPRSHTPRSWLQRVALHYVCAGAGPKVDCAVGPASSPAAALSSSSASSERPGWCYPTGRCAYLLSVTCYRQSIKPPPLSLSLFLSHARAHTHSRARSLSHSLSLGCSLPVLCRECPVVESPDSRQGVVLTGVVLTDLQSPVECQ